MKGDLYLGFNSSINFWIGSFLILDKIPSNFASKIDWVFNFKELNSLFIIFSIIQNILNGKGKLLLLLCLLLKVITKSFISSSKFWSVISFFYQLFKIFNAS